MLNKKLTKLRLMYDIHNKDDKKYIEDYYDALNALCNFSLDYTKANILREDLPDITLASNAIKTLNKLAAKKNMPLIFKDIDLKRTTDIIKAAHDTYNALNETHEKQNE